VSCPSEEDVLRGGGRRALLGCIACDLEWVEN